LKYVQIRQQNIIIEQSQKTTGGWGKLNILHRTKAFSDDPASGSKPVELLLLRQMPESI